MSAWISGIGMVTSLIEWVVVDHLAPVGVLTNGGDCVGRPPPCDCDPSNCPELLAKNGGFVTGPVIKSIRNIVYKF
jgi:hypothetical protein